MLPCYPLCSEGSSFRPLFVTSMRGRKLRLPFGSGSLIHRPGLKCTRRPTAATRPSRISTTAKDRRSFSRWNCTLIFFSSTNAAPRRRRVSKGFRVAGTLAVLGMAARRDLLNLHDAVDRLKRTSFHYRQDVLDQFLAEQGGKG